MWPGAGPRALSKMHTWICFHEFRQICQPTPPMISDDERKQMEGLFHAMDIGDKGHVTATDLVGGDDMTMQARLKHTIDHETATMILGHGEFTLTDFFELMCEDGFVAHPDAIRMVMPVGRVLVKMVREKVGFTGWVLKHPDA